jgi:nucleotide-binding universal stress UspA family protein
MAPVPPRVVLLPIDMADQDTAKAALAGALKLIPEDGVLHVASCLPDFGAAQVSQYFPDGYERDMLHRFGQALKDWVSREVPEGIETHPHVLHGTVYDEIIRAADKVGADVIVMGAHRPELSDYLLGSNAARVVRHATQSVYVIRY